jgi:hypothetical protein
MTPDRCSCRGHVLVAAALCLAGVLAAPAHELGAPVSRAIAWDCWVDGSGESTKVRCIVDLGGTPAEEFEPALEHMVLHQIHEMIHGPEDVQDLNRLLDRNWHVLREGDVWTIRIFSQPYEDSWRRGRPQQLVRNLLCPPRTPCRVHFKDHPPP